jgi:dolichol-phosphate mannosyltransferase
LQPALLASLVYRTGAPGRTVPASRLLANGQCFLVRRATLLEHGGYEPAKDSFADDVRLARHYAEHGVACAFLDGRLLYRVRSYHSAGEMWREWGRSVDLADATPAWQHRIDLAVLVCAQALPVPAFVAGLAWGAWPLVIINFLLLSIRFSVLTAIAPSYERRGLPFFMSWVLDPVAVVRVVLSTFRRPLSWRGRSYGGAGAATTQKA